VDVGEEQLWRDLGALTASRLRQPPVAILAFGSRALGFAVADSDYDL